MDRVIQKTKFVIMPNWLAKYCNAREISMYFALGKYKNNETNTCYPSISQLAKDMDISRDTAKRGLKGLIDKGIVIRTVRKTDNGKNTSNIYELMFDEKDVKSVAIGAKTSLVGLKNEPNTRVTDDPQTILNNNYTNLTKHKTNQDLSNTEYKGEIQKIYVNTVVEALKLDNITKNKWGQIYNTSKQLFEAGVKPEDIPTLVKNMVLTFGEQYVTVNSILNHTELIKGPKNKKPEDFKDMVTEGEINEWINND